jgi:hypothetical protein
MGMALAIATRGVICTGDDDGGSAQITDVVHPHLDTVVLSPESSYAAVLEPETLSADVQSADYTPTISSAVELDPNPASTVELRPVIISAEED